MRKEWIRSEEEKNKNLNHFEKHRKNKQKKRRLQVICVHIYCRKFLSCLYVFR